MSQPRFVAECHKRPQNLGIFTVCHVYIFSFVHAAVFRWKYVATIVWWNEDFQIHLQVVPAGLNMPELGF